MTATVAASIVVGKVDLSGMRGGYDTWGKGKNDGDGALAALSDCFGGAIALEEVIALIKLYFAA